MITATPQTQHTASTGPNEYPYIYVHINILTIKQYQKRTVIQFRVGYFDSYKTVAFPSSPSNQPQTPMFTYADVYTQTYLADNHRPRLQCAVCLTNLSTGRNIWTCLPN